MDHDRAEAPPRPAAPRHADDEGDPAHRRDVPLVPEHLRIQGLEDWLERNGLRAPGDDPDDPDDDTVAIREERARLRRGHDYEAALHKRFFAGLERAQEAAHRERLRTVRAAPAATIALVSDRDPDQPLVVPLVPLAMSCDTVFALVSSWNLYNQRHQVDDNDETSCQGSSSRHPASTISLSLPFGAGAVRQFVGLVLGTIQLSDVVSGHHRSDDPIGSKDGGAEHKSDDGGGEHAIIDCVRIAHYLQNTTLLEACVEVLLEAVDTDNCLALSQLADQLHLPRLFERAVAHMMDSIGNVSELLEQGQEEDVVTRELRDRIEAIQAAVRTSLHPAGRGRLYFSSLEEYIAIFAERVQYYRERLAEAQEQQAQRPRNSPGWRDAEVKIQRQQVRVQTLGAALQEQKRLFARCMQSKTMVES